MQKCAMYQLNYHWSEGSTKIKNHMKIQTQLSEVFCKKFLFFKISQISQEHIYKY